MTNSVDPDQIAPLGAVWFRTTLFAYAIFGNFGVRIFLDIYRI